MSERELRTRKYGREYIPTSLAESSTCRLLVVTDDQIEVLRNLINYAHNRVCWVDEVYGADQYYMPSDDDWDILEATVDDLEDKLMSQCDFVTLDDVNNRLGINQPNPAWGLDLLSADGVSMMDATDTWGLQFYDTEATFSTGHMIVLEAPYIRTAGKVGVGIDTFTGGGAQLELVDGITFPATQVPSADVHTLDDYEEGTCVVTMTPTTSGTITLKAAGKTLSYTKIGRVVHVTGKLVVESVSSPVGVIRVTGLPFACMSGDEHQAAACVAAHGMAVTAVTAMIGWSVPGYSFFDIYKWAAGSATAAAGDVQANTVFIISLSYHAAT